MQPNLNVHELLEIAIQIERNGAAFYRKAAEMAEDDANREQLTTLALMEDTHEQIFTAMQGAVQKDDAGLAPQDPEGEAARYLRAFAQGKIFDLTRDPLEFLGQPRTATEILLKAIDLERDSVMYYLGVKNVVAADLGGDQVDEIIRQEMGHISLLSGWLDQAR